MKIRKEWVQEQLIWNLLLLRLYLEQGVSYKNGRINSILNRNITSIDETKYHNS